MAVESMGSDPYETVLADLKAKRDQLDQAIAAIEAVRGTSTAASSGNGLPLGSDGPGAFLGMSIVDATKKLLATKRQALKVPDILAALKAGGLALNSKEPGNVIGSVLTRHFNEVGEIVRVERGLWGLQEWYPNRNFKKENGKDDPKGDSDEPEVKQSGQVITPVLPPTKKTPWAS